MKFAAGIHSVTDFGNDTIRFSDALAIIAECGFDRVVLVSVPGGPALRRGETPNGAFLNLATSDLDLVAGQSRRAGLDVEAVHAAGVDAGKHEAMDQSIDWLQAIAEAAAQLGCRYVGHSCGAASASGMSTADKHDEISRLAEIVDEVAATMPELHFAVDVHCHGVVETVADCEYYLEQLSSTNAGILLNTGHMTTCNQPGWELAQNYPDRTPIIGWKDHVPPSKAGRAFDSIQLGTGDTPFEKYIEVIKPQTTDRAHCIAFEHVPDDQRKATLRASREYIEDLWDRI